MLAIEAASASPEPPRRFIDASKRPPLYFTHMPKTGGTSLRSYLLDQYLPEDRCPTDSWKVFCALSAPERAHYRVFFGHPMPKASDFGPPEMQHITFLREPLARTISALRHLMRKPDFLKIEANRTRTLRDLIYDDAVMELFRDQMCRIFSIMVPMSAVQTMIEKHKQDRDSYTPRSFPKAVIERNRRDPDSYTPRDFPNEPTMKAAMKQLEKHYNFVGLTERYEDSLLAMSARFNFMPPLKPPLLNRASDLVTEQAEAEYRGITQAEIDHIRGYLLEDTKLYNEIAKNWAPSHGGFDAICRDLITNKTLTPITSPIAIDIGPPFSGSGWYYHETHDGRTVRWSGPGNTALLPLPLVRNHAWQVEITYSCAAKNAKVQFYVDGVKAKAQLKRENNQVIARFRVPPRANTPITTLAVDCSELQRASNADDWRMLGVLLTGVRVF